MRFVIYGAGAIGGVLGGRLFQAGADVTLVARGENAAVLRERGLELVVGGEATVLRVPTVEHPSELGLDDGVVILATKSQDTAAALTDLAAEVPRSTPVLCAQNGVDNERQALRRFEHVYGVHVMCPASHLRPGHVEAAWSPVPGMFDLGCYPAGTDAVCDGVALALRDAGLDAQARGDIMRWKYRKLLLNLANAVAALCGPTDGVGRVVERVKAEGEAVLRAAGIDVASDAEDRLRRGGLVARMTGLDSSSQSLVRQSGSIESDYLNGEIVLLGRLHGVLTPANAVVQRLANQAALDHRPPGSLPPADVLSRIEAAAPT